MLQRPTTSTLFPSRRSSDLCHARSLRASSRMGCAESANTQISALLRSEEHTSELQSPVHLVCRLLLEKKKKLIKKCFVFKDNYADHTCVANQTGTAMNSQEP